MSDLEVAVLKNLNSVPPVITVGGLQTGQHRCSVPCWFSSFNVRRYSQAGMVRNTARLHYLSMGSRDRSPKVK